MTTVRQLLVSVLCLALFTSSPAFASNSQNQHVVSPQQLAAAVDSHVANQDADRAAIHDALKRDDVQRVAAGMRVDLSRAHAAIDTMTGGDLAQAASAARQVIAQPDSVDGGLVGGANTVVLSTTMIIIILLVVILIIVAVK
ncbi:MAG TPA: hypothetical protein VKH42_12335 [Vicinamibacterales bacterium]|nr:hypothetical protein [Vicinamibacterales bacterium]